MIVGVGDEQYIVPLEFVAEAFKPAARRHQHHREPGLARRRARRAPADRAASTDVVQLPSAPASSASAEPICLVVEVDNRRAALLVDSLVGQQQLVVKSLDTNLHSVPGVAGATILGDGRVALILDVSSVTRTHRLARTAREPPHDGRHGPRRARVPVQRRAFPRDQRAHLPLLRASACRRRKREMVYARLARRLRSLGIASFDDYVRFLELEPAEWEHCTNALTTNVTAFYREEHHFAHRSPSTRARPRAPGEPFRVWSAGCSTGEEPYTIAMCLAEALGPRPLPGARDRPRHAGARHGARGASIRSQSVLKLARGAPEALLPARRRAATRARARVRPELAAPRRVPAREPDGRASGRSRAASTRSSAAT